MDPGAVCWRRGHNLLREYGLAFNNQLHTSTVERRRHTEALIEVCPSIIELQFSDAAQLALPTYPDLPEGEQVSGEEFDLVGTVQRSILANQLLDQHRLEACDEQRGHLLIA
ncbi:uncharacterized protein P174DRAFT_286928 [Aspergillus novofumigatus IBT 16806]|uniref:Uncharacterized protein n=1 Tax=Aspergillus novofumigatus (strain IBT 16806) TaxID=1392255 RepID=A0A2I1C141_ASPN1|nr:uncharacterized protein P174DRAFT_286928 [Aspergillus novofumigatus IBT 16806]PKX91303.1 hypothetical protein P174DRAFT_286928 [Aspergillus novofumigatus IBT 16806]